MIASRLPLYLVFFLTLAVAIATPIARLGDKRADALDAEAALNTLKTSTNSILSQMNDLISKGTATGAAMTPLVNDLISATNSAASSLGTLQSVGAPASNGMAALMADIISDIAATTNNARGIPIIPGASAGVDVTLSGVVVVLQSVVTAVLGLVSVLTGVPVPTLPIPPL